ncbi:hypothetical protein, partial [Streptomyces alkaliterrae]
PPPPPSGGGKGKTIGLVVGAVVLVGAIIGGAVLVLGDDDKGPNNAGKNSVVTDDGAHKLEAPPKIGKFTKQASLGQGLEAQIERDVKHLPIEDPESLFASYSTVDASDPSKLDPAALATMETLGYVGAWGKINDPDAAVDKYFDVLKQGSRPGGQIELIGDVRAVTPPGLSGAVMKCQETKITIQPGQPPQQSATCVWADKSTLGAVSPGKSPLGGGTTVDAAARLAVEVRDNTRVAAD